MIWVMLVVIVGMALTLYRMRERMSACPEVLLLRQVNGHVEDAHSEREQDEQKSERSPLFRGSALGVDHAVEPCGGGTVPESSGFEGGGAPTFSPGRRRSNFPPRAGAPWPAAVQP